MASVRRNRPGVRALEGRPREEVEEAALEYLDNADAPLPVSRLSRALAPTVTRATRRPVGHRGGESPGLTGPRAIVAATGVLASLARAGRITWELEETRPGHREAVVSRRRRNPPRPSSSSASLDSRLGTSIVTGRAVPGATRRRNPPLPVRTFTGKSGHLVSEHVLAIDYRHASSAKRAAYRHDFGEGVELWALRDGSLLLRGGHGQRLWEDFFVSDAE